MKKAAFLFFRVEVGNAACAVQYLVVVQTMLVRCPKNLDFTVFQKVSLSNLIFIDARTAGDMARKVQSGKGFPFEAFSCTNYTNLVQYLGIGSGAEEEMRNYILEFMQYVLSEDKQQSLMELGLIPAVVTKNQPESETPAVGAMYENSSQLAVPQCFLYATYEDQLCQSAEKALSGDENAKKDLDLRLMELVQGAGIK